MARARPIHRSGRKSRTASARRSVWCRACTAPHSSCPRTHSRRLHEIPSCRAHRRSPFRSPKRTGCLRGGRLRRSRPPDTQRGTPCSDPTDLPDTPGRLRSMRTASRRRCTRPCRRPRDKTRCSQARRRATPHRRCSAGAPGHGSFASLEHKLPRTRRLYTRSRKAGSATGRSLHRPEPLARSDRSGGAPVRTSVQHRRRHSSYCFARPSCCPARPSSCYFPRRSPARALHREPSSPRCLPRLGNLPRSQRRQRRCGLSREIARRSPPASCQLRTYKRRNLPLRTPRDQALAGHTKWMRHECCWPCLLGTSRTEYRSSLEARSEIVRSCNDERG
jgi:hypothetical protein